MALASIDPKVLMGQARCFSCLTPIQQLRVQTYLLASLAGFDTSFSGVAALSSASACMSCLTTEQLLAIKAYLLTLALNLPTTQAGVRTLEQSARCVLCLTPKEQFQLQTYLFALSDGQPTTAAGVRAIAAAAKCFSCLDKKQQLEVQVYILTQLAPSAPQIASDLAAGAACFISCTSGEILTALLTSLIIRLAVIALPPCVTPSTPIIQSVTPSPLSPSSVLRVRWKQPANSGSLITGYIISWGTVSGVYTNNSGFRPLAFDGSYDISLLSSGTTYFVVVQAVTSISGCVSATSAEKSGSTAGGGGGGTDPVVTDWANRVVINGGAMPSNATISAVDTFYKGLKSDGIDTLMIAVNIIAPDNLIAAQTPLIKVKGNDPWTNTNFAAGNLSANGLATVGGVSMYLETGVNPTTAYSSDNDAGYTWYAGSAGVNNAIAWAFNGGSSDAIFANGSNYNCGCHNTWDMTPAIVGTGLQFGSVNRTGAAAADFYLANSVLGFTHPGTSAGAPAARVNLTIPFGLRNFNGAYGLPPAVAVTYSFMAIHHGLTSAQAQALFNRVQTLRTAFGGGFT